MSRALSDPFGYQICVADKVTDMCNCWTMHFTMFQLLTQCQRDIKYNKGNLDNPSNVNIKQPY